jgi:hypothetical protein
VGTTLRKTRVLRFSPNGTADTLDTTDINPGACTVLNNIVADPSTKNIWTLYPNITKIVDFSALSSPGIGACFIVVGNYIYGLLQSSLNSGKDEVYAYSINPTSYATTNLTVYNVNSNNSPTSQGNSPAYPATMTLVGSTIWVTHMGFNGGGGYYIGFLDISIPNQPVWRAGNLNQTGAITAFGTLTGGSGYASGGTQTFFGVPLTGGTGTLANATVFVTAGVVTRVAINSPGSAYTVGDSLSASNANLGGSGTGFAIVVAATQTTGAIQLTTIPSWGAQFYERAWLGINPTTGIPSVIYSDILKTGCTNANQALTFNDNLITVGAGGLGLNNQLGGVVQSLMIFKGSSYIVQITGDAALSTLSVNSIPTSTGTTAVRSIVGTPIGLAFVSPDGVRIIDFNARVSDPVGANGEGVTVPFVYSNNLFPQSTNSGFNRGVLRVTVNTAVTIGGLSSNLEFWYDQTRKSWSGPHGTSAGASTQYQSYQDVFIFQPIEPNNVLAPLYLSSVYEHTAAPISYTWSYQTAMLPNDQQMSQMEITELQIVMSASTALTGFTVNILDQDGNVIATSSVTPNPSTTPSTSGLYPRQVTFTSPVVVNRFAIQVTGTTGDTIDQRFGDIYIRVRDLDYLQELPG